MVGFIYVVKNHGLAYLFFLAREQNDVKNRAEEYLSLLLFHRSIGAEPSCLWRFSESLELTACYKCGAMVN